MKYVIANWKMGPPTVSGAEALAAGVVRSSRDFPKDVRVVLCPPFVWLDTVRRALVLGGTCLVGAQDAFLKEGGAYTGEISVAMLKSLGVSHVIVGHSERRALGESNAIVAEKLRVVLGSGLTAILCVGEKNREGVISNGNESSVHVGRGPLNLERSPDAGRDWHQFLREEVEAAFAVVDPKDCDRLIVAYEPVWAIGGEVSDTPDSALTAALFIRKIAREHFGEGYAAKLPVLYGGSVLVNTVAPIALQEGIDGVLVGRASLDAKALHSIVRIIGSATSS